MQRFRDKHKPDVKPDVKPDPREERRVEKTWRTWLREKRNGWIDFLFGDLIDSAKRWVNLLSWVAGAFVAGCVTGAFAAFVILWKLKG